MAILTHIVQHLLIIDLLHANLLEMLHPGPSLCNADSKLSLKCLGQEADWIGGEGAHGSTMYNSTQGWSEQQPTVYLLPLYGTDEHNCTFNGSGGTRCVFRKIIVHEPKYKWKNLRIQFTNFLPSLSIKEKTLKYCFESVQPSNF